MFNYDNENIVQFDRAVRLFGEDNSTIQPDDFFGIFDLFLTSFNEAKHDLENIRKRRDEEEKRAKQEIEVSIYSNFFIECYVYFEKGRGGWIFHMKIFVFWKIMHSDIFENN